MIRLILYLALLVPFAYGAIWLADNPGDITIDWFGYRISTTLALVIAALVVALILAGVVILGLRFLFGIPTSIRHHHIVKRQDNGIKALTHAMSALAIADYSSAEKQIKKAQHYLGDKSAAPLLLSTQLEHARGNKGKVREYLGSMIQSDETRLVGLRGMIEQSMRDNQHSKAVEYAREAWQAQPYDRWLSLILLDLLCRNEQWADALDVVDKASRNRAFNHADSKRYEAIVYYQRARALIKKKEFDTAMDVLKLSYKRDKHFVPTQIQTVKLLARTKDYKSMMAKISLFWKTEPKEDYVNLMLDHFSDEPANKLLKRFEKLTSQNTEHVESQIAMARLAIHQAKWQRARDYLKIALTKQESPRIYELLAKVEKGELGDDKQSAEWLKRAVNAPKDAVWACGKCGHQSSNWQLYCGSCNAFDSAVWEYPEQTNLIEESAPTSKDAPSNAA